MVEPKLPRVLHSTLDKFSVPPRCPACSNMAAVCTPKIHGIILKIAAVRQLRCNYFCLAALAPRSRRIIDQYLDLMNCSIKWVSDS